MMYARVYSNFKLVNMQINLIYIQRKQYHKRDILSRKKVMSFTFEESLRQYIVIFLFYKERRSITMMYF